jgi:hypothetical protein
VCRSDKAHSRHGTEGVARTSADDQTMRSNWPTKRIARSAMEETLCACGWEIPSHFIVALDRGEIASVSAESVHVHWVPVQPLLVPAPTCRRHAHERCTCGARGEISHRSSTPAEEPDAAAAATLGEDRRWAAPAPPPPLPATPHHAAAGDDDKPDRRFGEENAGSLAPWPEPPSPAAVRAEPKHSARTKTRFPACDIPWLIF